MDIARTMQEVEDLPGLCYSAEQGIVAPCPFLLLVVTHGRAFGMTLGGLHRAIEVQGHSGWRQAHQAGQDPILEESPEVLDALGSGLLQGPAERRHVRQSLEAEHAFDQGVVFIVAAVLEFPIAQQQVDNQLDKEGGPMEDLSLLEIAEALAQLSLEIDGGEELLDEDQPCKRGERLALEPHFGQGMGFTSSLGSAKLHGGPPCAVPWLISHPKHN